MSFTFSWPRFSDQFHYDAIQMLNTALNKGNKPPIIADRIEVVELEMGTQPPELEIRDIGDLTVDQFRGIFRLTYSGDAHLVLKTKVQANPLNHKQPDIHLISGSRMLAAKQPLVVPMLLRLSHFKLNSYVVLVVSKQKGITIVFKTDPLQNVDINSTFDSIAVIQSFIQREIEGQLRQMFREDLPGIIHRLSQQWIKAEVEAPYLHKHHVSPVNRQERPFDTSSITGESYKSMPSIPIPNNLHAFPVRRSQSSSASVKSFPFPKRPRSTSTYSSSISKSRPQQPPSLSLSSEPVTFPDLENFDPTYGLRPEGLPNKSVFSGFRSLFAPNLGLAELSEEPGEDGEETDDDDDDGAASFDIVNWEYTVPASSIGTYDNERSEKGVPQPEYETIPAVGGGTVTRPRIYHSQSMIQTNQTPDMVPPSKHRSSLSLHQSIVPPRSGLAIPDLALRDIYGTHLGGLASVNSATALPQTAPPNFSTYERPVTPDSLETQPSGSSSGRDFTTSTPPTEPYDDYHNAHHCMHQDSSTYGHPPPPLSPIAPSSRRPSISPSSNFEDRFGSPSALPASKIILRPATSNSIHQLSTLSYSNHTLSPYTRNLQHFTVRSVPPRSAAPLTPAERQPVKAKRKRIFHLGGTKSLDPRDAGVGTAENDSQSEAKSERPPHREGVADLDVSDMDRYFRLHDDYELEPGVPLTTPPRSAPGAAGRVSPAPAFSHTSSLRQTPQRPFPNHPYDVNQSLYIQPRSGQPA